MKEPDCSSPGCWASVEYLLWWVKGAPLPPLASTGDPQAAAAAGLPVAALGTPGTVLLSPNQQNFGPLSGGRVAVGTWLDPARSFGVEASGFLMETRSNGFAFHSDANGSPVLGVPAIGTPPQFPTNQESAQIMSFPGSQQGGVMASSTVRLWGVDASGVYNAWSTSSLRLNLLAGVRYLDLAERLSMTDTTTFLPPVLPVTFQFNDLFATRNQVYAGQLGGRAEVNYDMFFLNLTGKVGLGTNHESININGNTTISLPPGTPFLFAPPVAPLNGGGFFAQSTNIGRRTRDQLVVVPEVHLQVGVNLTDRIRAFVGYDFLYLNRVVRPGDQIDRTVNGSQGFGGMLVGQSRPQPLFNSTDFWAQGISLGLALRF